MDREYIAAIKDKLSTQLPKKRYEHSVGVSYISSALAMRYGADIYKAELAGILHDCAKAYSNKELIILCKEAGIELLEDELKSPSILHAIYGKHLAKKAYLMEDEEVLSAIRWHTTGKADMSLLDKIVYIADYIEPNRKKLEKLDSIRRLAFEDIDKALYEIVKSTIEYLDKENMYVNSMSLACYNWLKEKGSGY